MKDLTQKELIIHYVEANGSITPAKMGGKLYLGQMFGSETSKRCRELRKAGKLISHGEGKFEVFGLAARIPEQPLILDSQPSLGLSPARPNAYLL
jgi:hypothetical protein